MSALLLAAIAAAAAGVLTWLVIAYARLTAMHDAPGARRMHRAPTVRGAGLGFVLTTIAGWGAFGASIGWTQALGRWAILTAVALTLVAVVSWIDDRRGLPVWPRLLTHLVAVLLVGASVWSGEAGSADRVLGVALAMLVLLPGINFWNFIDGINGMAATLGAAAALGFAAYAWSSGDYPAAWFAALLVGALLGFLPYNFPHARAFMGDVGSATLGLAITAMTLLPMHGPEPALWVVLPLLSAVFLDAGLTLLWRMARRPRRRWYTAHREHSYQWLARSGWGHTRTTLAYLAWTVGPGYLVVWIVRERPEFKLIAILTLYAVGALVWRGARDYALARARRLA